MAKLFTKEEDTLILSVTSEVKKEGIALTTAFFKISDELAELDPSAIERRYKRLKIGRLLQK